MGENVFSPVFCYIPIHLPLETYQYIIQYVVHVSALLLYQLCLSNHQHRDNMYIHSEVGEAIEKEGKFYT